MFSIYFYNNIIEAIFRFRIMEDVNSFFIIKV
jgi:hypothetical protein